MIPEQYYWVRAKNGNGEIVGQWEPAYLDKQNRWTPLVNNLGWLNEPEFRSMFDIHPEPIQPPTGRH